MTHIESGNLIIRADQISAVAHGAEAPTDSEGNRINGVRDVYTVRIWMIGGGDDVAFTIKDDDRAADFLALYRRFAGVDEPGLIPDGDEHHGKFDG